MEFFLIDLICLNPNFLKMFFDIIKFYKNSDQINVTDQKLNFR